MDRRGSFEALVGADPDETVLRLSGLPSRSGSNAIGVRAASFAAASFPLSGLGASPARGHSLRVVGPEAQLVKSERATVGYDMVGIDK